MTEREKKITLADVPDPGRLEEKGISINAPTPSSFSIPNPWPSAAQQGLSPNGQGAGPDGGKPATQD